LAFPRQQPGQKTIGTNSLTTQSRNFSEKKYCKARSPRQDVWGYVPAGAKHLIITGVNADGTDQITGSLDIAFIAEDGGGGGGTGDQSAPCPGTPGCPQNVLTGG
jgi:hypothetical protein